MFEKLKVSSMLNEHSVKRDYIAPKVMLMDMEAVEMLAASSIGYTDDKASNDYEALGNKRRGEWGDLWD